MSLNWQTRRKLRKTLISLYSQYRNTIFGNTLFCPPTGCMLLLSEADGKSCPEQEMSPHYVLLAEDSIVQAVPEHPKKENVFCLSNAYGDVYLFQVCIYSIWQMPISQSDKESLYPVTTSCISHLYRSLSIFREHIP